MNKQTPQRPASTRATPAQTRTKHTAAAGISNRPPREEEQQQQQLPPRGQAKKKTAGGKG